MSKPIHMNVIDREMFVNRIDEIDIPDRIVNVDETISTVTASLYQCAKDSRQVPQMTPVHSDNNNMERWDRLVTNKEDLKLW